MDKIGKVVGGKDDEDDGEQEVPSDASDDGV